MASMNKRPEDFSSEAGNVVFFRQSHSDKLGKGAISVSNGNMSQSGKEPSAMTGPTREELDAKIAASEARADARMTGLFHQFEGRLFQHIDAKLDAIEGKFAGVDAKFAGMESRFGNMDAKLSGMQTDVAVMNNRMALIEEDIHDIRGVKGTVVNTGIAVVGTVITTGIAVVGLTVAVMAYGGQWFGMGMDASAVAEQAADRALEKRVSEKQVLNKSEKLASPAAPEPSAK